MADERRYLVFQLEGGEVVKTHLDEPEFVGQSDEKIIEATTMALNVMAALGRHYTIIEGEVVNVMAVQSVAIETVGGLQ